MKPIRLSPPEGRPGVAFAPRAATLGLACLAVLGLALVGCARSDDRAGADAISVSGTIEVVDAHLGFKIPGRLAERLVDEGRRIEAGQLIARLDEVELAQQLEIRRAEQAAAQAMLAELEAGARPQEIAAGEATLASAEAEQARTRLEFQRQRELLQTEAAAKREFETAEAQLGVAEARVAEAKERLALVREGPRMEAIAQARARAAQAGAVVALAETQLANTRLEAPFSGIILEKHAEPGEFLTTGAPVVTITDTSHVWLRAYVDQTDLGRVRLGQEVDVRTDTFPDQIYRGRLAFISSEAEFTPKTVQTHKERVKLVFRIRIDLDNPDGELKPGMPADAVLKVARRE